MPQHEIKICPRCNRTFECKVGNVLECQCSQVRLTYEERTFVEGLYKDCLCIDCLRLLREKFNTVTKE